MKNKYLIIVVVLILALALTSCGKQKAEAKLAEKLSEKILEKATGSKVDLDFNNDGEVASIKTEEGEMTFGSGLPWPSDKLPGIPEPKGINVVSFAQLGEEGYSTLSFTGLDRAQMKSYIKELKTLGFRTISESHFVAADNFSGADQQGKMVSIYYSYDENEKEGTTVMTLGQVDPEDLDYLDEDGGYENQDLTKWPHGFIVSLPELEADLSSQIVSRNFIILSLENIQDAKMIAYVEELKIKGFTEGMYEARTQDSSSYSGSNQDGERITVSWDKEGNVHIQLSKED